ncbi:RNA helicase aquarius [Toxorhynchites rutilus septentrionalis]|uniref:RNA helicase aquarius n=1 Tax=Toxorhynchites rutilus septentrionalis TaxID=329112 RepID=UPI002478D00A|nr:RNA helicase aquarius [Toxorhynchites rutilus septentrionalis]
MTKTQPTEELGAKVRKSALTVSQINADELTFLANRFWAPDTAGEQEGYNPSIIDEIYRREICESRYSMRRIMMLEFSQYLENYLWPNYRGEEATRAHLMSIVIMLNEKFREKVEVWKVFESNADQFPVFFQKVLEACLEESAITPHGMREQTFLLMFLNHCFNSMEVEMCRNQAKRLVSLAMWSCLQPKRREQELKEIPEWRRFWKKLQKRDKAEQKQKLDWERHFLQNLTIKFMNILESIPAEGVVCEETVRYCERFLEFLIDLEALLPTRRFFNTVMDDCHVVVRCSMAPLLQRDEGNLFAQLLDMLKFYARFEINDETGDPLTDHDMTQLHYSKIKALQKAAFAKFPDLRMFALSNVANVDTRESLEKHFGALDGKSLKQIACYLNLVPEELTPPFDWHRLDEPFLRELLISRHERRVSQLESLNEMPLYPTEEIIWNENIVPTEYYSGEGCLALPKLNLQFLTLHDYLLRNFNLFRLESTYEIRQDIEDAVSRMLPWESEEGDVVFGGWARMALPIQSFAVVEVSKPHIGEKKPSRVRADVSVTLNVRKEIQEEWENLRKHDVCFLINVRPTKPIGTKYDYKEHFIPQVGLVHVRGCEIEGMLDANGRVIEDGIDQKPQLTGEQRTYRVWLDSNQYRVDMDSLQTGGDDVYEGFNIIMRRKPKENNFKAVLETIRHLMNTECVVPPWLHDILLGYGDPGAAHYNRMSDQARVMDFNDTFLDIDHVRNGFPGYEMVVKETDPQKLVRPFRLTFEDVPERMENSDEEEGGEKKVELPKRILIEPYVIPKRGPYKYNEPKKNTIRFTPTQVEAIKAGMQPGLTLVVGPPGTGKTDVAVQIISNLYHNHPQQRTLIVTHSNQALNQLFEKIMALDIDERHLLRLGHGEESLETEKDYSRYGRVNYVLSKRIDLLGQVQRLQDSLGVVGDVAYTCETAGHFYLYQIIARWEKFLNDFESSKEYKNAAAFEEEFPFTKFFNDAPQPLFHGSTYEENMDVAHSCYRYISHIFTELEEFRAFELLRSGLDRSKYLLVKEAKVIAMTCTHAALKRKELVNMGFKYDNILMEESAQILEIETFIPLLLQNPMDGYNRLKRWIMIGDHHQLPPVIKNMAFQKYSNMEQSLFTRLVRLGVPTIDLDGQGRARSGICELYKWRYTKLGDLDHINQWAEYINSNPGFVYDYQLINVEDFNGVGESEPNPYFYQNLAEAEYIVALFMYMRLLGYPAEKISILTTYNGQKHLIRDVIEARCADNSLIGRPHKVTTVDKYQGQQNDYILLSLVRTKTIGHIRDVRRLVVAMSRARLGLYIFGRVSLFKNCVELQPAFKLLTKRPLQLHLSSDETYPSARKLGEGASQKPEIIKDMQEMAQFVYNYYMKKVNVIRTEMEKMKELYEQHKKTQEANKPIPEEIETEPAEKQTSGQGKPEEFAPTLIRNEIDFDEQLEVGKRGKKRVAQKPIDQQENVSETGDVVEGTEGDKQGDGENIDESMKSTEENDAAKEKNTPEIKDRIDETNVPEGEKAAEEEKTTEEGKQVEQGEKMETGSTE